MRCIRNGKTRATNGWAKDLFASIFYYLAFAAPWVDRSNYTIIDVLAALDDPLLGRTVEAIHSLGWEILLAGSS